jgi:hypothetical protein
MSTLSVGTPHWSDEERELLGFFADLLIPSDGEMPSATQVDVHVLGVETVGALRPDLVAPVRALLQRTASDPPQTLERLMDEHPDEFEALAEMVAGAYFLDARVAERLGYRARRALPLEDVDKQSDDLLELVGPVLANASRWRSTPKQD